MFFFKTILKSIVYVTAFVLFGLCLTAILHKDHLRLITEFETLKEVDPRIRATELADKGDYCQALAYMEYFMDYNYVRENPAMVEYYGSLKEGGTHWLSEVKTFGMVYGLVRAHALSR